MKIKADNLEDWGKALRRELLDEIDSSIQRLSRGEGWLSEESVHGVRKSMKKVRAGVKLLREVKGMKGMVKEANEVFRDAGRPLSEVRDAEVMVTTLGELMKHFGDRADSSVGNRLTTAMSRRRGKLRAEIFDEQLARWRVLDAVRLGRKQVMARKPPTVGADELIEAVTTVYRTARKTFAATKADSDVQAFHEARKRAKDFRYAMELCLDFCPSFAPMAEAAHELTNALGTDHDLAVLRELLSSEDHVTLKNQERSRMFALIDEWRKELRRQAKKVGVKLYAEKARVFRKRLHASSRR